MLGKRFLKIDCYVSDRNLAAFVNCYLGIQTFSTSMEREGSFQFNNSLKDKSVVPLITFAIGNCHYIVHEHTPEIKLVTQFARCFVRSKFSIFISSTAMSG